MFDSSRGFVGDLRLRLTHRDVFNAIDWKVESFTRALGAVAGLLVALAAGVVPLEVVRPPVELARARAAWVAALEVPVDVGGHGLLLKVFKN